MATAKEVMGGGFPAGQANAMGGIGASIVAAGSVQGDATLVSASIAIVTAADGTKGVILPGGSVGDEIWVFNSSGSTLKVYPHTGAAISVAGTGLGTVNAAFSQLTQKCTLYKLQSSTQWFAVTSA
jgi:hypothetical protein